MICDICFGDDINEKDMHYMECLHFLCFECFCKLKTENCPFCRGEINLFSEEYQYENDNIEYLSNEIEDDFVVPLSRINRQEHRRNKKIKKQQKLQTLLNIDNIDYNFFRNNINISYKTLKKLRKDYLQRIEIK